LFKKKNKEKMRQKMLLSFEIKIENENIDPIWMMSFLVFII